MFSITTLSLYDVYMRITLTLEPDVERKLKARMAAQKLTLKAAINQALREGLAAEQPPTRPRFRVEPHSFGFKPGIDPDKRNQLVDELEAEELSRKFLA